jgi:hypothetical protein
MSIAASNRRAVGDAGFTVIELLVATALMMVVTGAIFSLMNPTQGMFQAQPEVSDMQQRLRVGIDSMQKDLMMAGAGTYTGQSAGTLTYFMAPLTPYKMFGTSPDPVAGVFFRNDAISFMYVPPTPSQTTISDPMPAQSSEIKVTPQPNCPGNKQNQLCGFEENDHLIIFDEEGHWDFFTVTEVQDAAAHLQHRLNDFSTSYAAGSNVTAILAGMYYLNANDATKTYQLMFHDGVEESAVVDNVVKLEFQYFGEAQPPQLTGKPLANKPGPWTTYGPVPPQLGTVKGGWPAGENCTFMVQNGQHAPRLPPLAAGIGQVELTEALLTDGPWCPNAAATNRFDADVLRVRRVRVTVRVQAALASLRGPASALFMKGGTATVGAKFVPDQEIRFDVTPRNMNLGR